MYLVVVNYIALVDVEDMRGFGVWHCDDADSVGEAGALPPAGDDDGVDSRSQTVDVPGKVDALYYPRVHVFGPASLQIIVFMP